MWSCFPDHLLLPPLSVIPNVHPLVRWLLSSRHNHTGKDWGKLKEPHPGASLASVRTTFYSKWLGASGTWVLHKMSYFFKRITIRWDFFFFGRRTNLGSSESQSRLQIRALYTLTKGTGESEFRRHMWAVCSFELQVKTS